MTEHGDPPPLLLPRPTLEQPFDRPFDRPSDRPFDRSAAHDRDHADADALRKATGLPTYDAITCCNFFMSGVQDNPRFGINDWQERFEYAATELQTSFKSCRRPGQKPARVLTRSRPETPRTNAAARRRTTITGRTSTSTRRRSSRISAPKRRARQASTDERATRSAPNQSRQECSGE